MCPARVNLGAIRREVWNKILFEHGFASVPLLELTCSSPTKLWWPCIKGSRLSNGIILTCTWHWGRVILSPGILAL